MWRVERATVRFGTTTALDDVTLTVGDGELVVVLGPSGCGKSTLLRVIAGLQPPDSGRVVVDGVDATAWPPHTRDIGMVFQDHALFPHRDVGRNVEFGLRMQGVGPPERRQRVREMLALVGLPGTERRDVATLSGGEAQRVALARSLAPRPRLLLLDEPLGALDRPRRDRLVDDLPALLRATGAAAVHVTHDHDEAFALADRLVVMDRGRVCRDDTPQAVFDDPRSVTVARFLGHRNITGAGPAASVIRFDAATLDPGGDLEVTVVGARFRGDHHEVVVRADDGATLVFHLPTAPPTDARVRLRIDPDRVVPLPYD